MVVRAAMVVSVPATRQASSSQRSSYWRVIGHRQSHEQLPSVSAAKNGGPRRMP